MQAAGTQWITYPSRSTKIRIWYLADPHWMSRSCAEGKLASDIQEIADDPDSYWVGGGDYCEFIGRKDKRFDPKTVAEWVTVEQLGHLAESGYHGIRDMFMPIRHKCLGLVSGNHEYKCQLDTDQQQWTQWLCCELGVKNLEYSAIFDVVLVRAPGTKKSALIQQPLPHDKRTNSWRIRCYAHHGAGAARTPGSKLNKLVALMKQVEADVFMMGHVHDQMARREPMLAANADCTELQAKDRIGIISGSYFRTYAQDTTSYGERNLYAPVNLGAASVTLCPGNGDKPNRIKAEV